MNAITFILKEHAKIKERLTLISQKTRTESSRKKMFRTLCIELLVHETTEEKQWYPYLKTYPELKAIIKHLITEEKAAAKVIKEFKKVKTELAWKHKFAKLKKAVLAHAGEEEKKLLPKANKLVDKKVLVELGKDMRKFKSALKKEILASKK